MEGMQVPGTPAGKLTCIDLSWRDDLAPNIAKYCLHHAGTLKTLKVAGISTHKDDISVVAEAIIAALHHPGWPMPAEWKGKLHFLMDAKNIFRTDQIVVIPSLGGWSGWTERTTATAVTDGKKYYVHAASGQSRWAPPEAVFGKVTGRVQCEGSKDYYVDAGSGQPQVFNAGHLVVSGCHAPNRSVRIVVSISYFWNTRLNQTCAHTHKHTHHMFHVVLSC
jgi:hypothetical protein